jgi:hypothetical protein
MVTASKFTRSRREAAITETEARPATTLAVFLFLFYSKQNMLSRSGLVVKFVLAMHEPRVRFTAATLFCPLRACYHIFCSVITLPESIGDVVCSHELSGALIEALDSTHNCCRKAFNACITKHTVGRLSENG